MPEVPIPALDGGIHRRELLARPNQVVDGLNVVATDGELRRRAAYRSIAATPAFLLPDGATQVVWAASGGALTTLTDRRGAITSAVAVYVGNTVETFTAIDWNMVAVSNILGAAARKIAVDYWNGTAWTQLPWWLDTTTTYGDASTGDITVRPLAQNGQISWHVAAPTGWATTSVNSITAYWVRIRVLTYLDVEATLSSGLGSTHTIQRPGVRTGQLQAVRGLFPAPIGGTQGLVAAHDRVVRRGMERGAALAYWALNRTRRMLPIHIATYEGAGLIDQTTIPAWTGGVATTLGTDGTLIDTDASSNFDAEPFRGAPIYTLAVSAAISTSEFNFVWAGHVVFGTAFQDLWQDLIIVCRTNTSSGTPVGETRRVWRHSPLGVPTTDTWRIRVYDAWSIAPNTGNTFAVYVVPAHVRTAQAPEAPFRVYGESNALLTLPHASSVGSRPFDFIPTEWPVIETPVHYAVEWELRWRVNATNRWAAAYHPIQRRLLLTNGASGLLAFDGRRLRYDEADTTSVLARLLTATLPDTPDMESDATAIGIRRGLLHSAPRVGKYIVNFNGRWLSAGFVDYPNSVQYTYVGASGARIWPKAYEAAVFDSNSRPITGLAALADRCVVFTSMSIHEGAVDANGFISFQATSQKAGFTAHDAVAPILYGDGVGLVGVAPDGIILYAPGGGVRYLLPTWSDVLEGGVNVSALSNAVCTVWAQEQRAFFAVAGAGSATNNRILELDYSDPTTPKWWVHSAPFGVSSMATVVTVGGQEQILIGTDDGFVQTFHDAATDDGVAISANAKTAPLQPGMADMTVTKANLTLRALGSAETLTIGVYIGRRDSVETSGAMPLGIGLSTYSSTVYPNPSAPASSDARYGDERYHTYHIGIPLVLDPTIQIELSGSSRWAYSKGSLEVRKLSTKVR